MVNYWLAKQEPSEPWGYNFAKRKENSLVWSSL